MSENESYQEFPRMIYHAIEGEKVVNNDQELSICLEQGWKKEPIKVEDQEVVLKEKIAWHTKEAEMLKKSLSVLYEERIRQNNIIIEAEKAVEEKEVKEVPIIESTPVLDDDKEPDIGDEALKEEVKEDVETKDVAAEKPTRRVRRTNI